jgi:hypothetical protein
VFWEKSAQAIENKGQELKKERQESSRVRKVLKDRQLDLELCERVAGHRGNGEADFAEVWQRKELAGWWDTSWDIIPSG